MEQADRDLLERAYRRDGADLWRATYAFSGGRRDVADEAVAEAFAQACRAVGNIRDLHAWLYRAAFRIAAGSMAAQRIHRTVPLDGIDRTARDNAAMDSDLRDLVDALTPKQRQAFVLREVIGFSTAETATLMNGTVVAVRVHVHGARVRLRRQHEEVDP